MIDSILPKITMLLAIGLVSYCFSLTLSLESAFSTDKQLASDLLKKISFICLLSILVLVILLFII